MKNISKVFLGLALAAIGTFAFVSLSPEAQAESQTTMVSSARVSVIKDWASCYDLIFCGTNQRVSATYNGTADFSIPNTYDITYYNGGCGIVVTSVSLSTGFCP